MEKHYQNYISVCLVCEFISTRVNFLTQMTVSLLVLILRVLETLFCKDTFICVRKPIPTHLRTTQNEHSFIST